MKKSLLYITIAIAAFSPLGVQAQSSDLSKQYNACMDKSDGVTLVMVECIGAENQRQDQRLNKNYKALMASLSAERKKQLQEAQRAWITFRDSNCRFYYDPDGGSMARISANNCVMTMTADRAKELEHLTQ